MCFRLILQLLVEAYRELKNLREEKNNFLEKVNTIFLIARKITIYYSDLIVTFIKYVVNDI